MSAEEHGCPLVRKVRKVSLDNTSFRDAGRSCAVSVGFFLLFLFVNQSEASLKLYLTPTPITHKTTFVRPKLDAHLNP